MWRQSEYARAKQKYVEQDFGFSTLSGSLSPLNVLNKISEKVQKYAKKEKEQLDLANQQLVKVYNKLVDLSTQKCKKFTSELAVHKTLAI